MYFTVNYPKYPISPVIKRGSVPIFTELKKTFKKRHFIMTCEIEFQRWRLPVFVSWQTESRGKPLFVRSVCLFKQSVIFLIFYKN